MIKGGSTEEAQSSIGQEVSQALIKFVNTGSSLAAVNFPEIDLRVSGKGNIVRIVNVHHNVPGVLKVMCTVCSLLCSKSTKSWRITILKNKAVIPEGPLPILLLILIVKIPNMSNN
jgi:hypothetical protein